MSNLSTYWYRGGGGVPAGSRDHGLASVYIFTIFRVQNEIVSDLENGVRLGHGIDMVCSPRGIFEDLEYPSYVLMWDFVTFYRFYMN